MQIFLKKNILKVSLLRIKLFKINLKNINFMLYILYTLYYKFCLFYN